ncbi:MAG: hypothetical protein E7559_09190 [Ruminococcaceae bacterium]|nr:hypothetical protein [Oscillospiraceae bacterium]
MPDNGRSSLKQLFGYIRALSERRFTTMYDWKDYGFCYALGELPQHQAVSCPSFSDPEDSAAAELILEVRKTDVPECPEPPVSLAGWLMKGWDDPSVPLCVAQKRYRMAADLAAPLVYENPQDRKVVWEIAEEAIVKDEEETTAADEAAEEAVAAEDIAADGEIAEAEEAAEEAVEETAAPLKAAEEIEYLSDDPARVQLFELWKGQRDAWAAAACEAARARKLYERLYALYSELERDRDRLELMVGDGLLEATLSDGTKVCHPLFLERVLLIFDSGVPSFTIRDTDANPILYSRLLRGIPELENSCLSEYASIIEREQIHPFEGSRFDELLTNFANSISSDCEYVPFGESSKAKYTIRRGAVLFTRPRASGYGAILDKIIEDIENGGELAPSLLSIIGENDQPEQEQDTDRPGSSGAMEVNGLDSSVLLEKAANREQLIIARKLTRCPAVLVQGPPGTGKTHTIANIIGDLLAQGKSVLVTSHTSKALSVLRDKISEPVRPLCVSVLDDNRRQLEQSLTAINEYMSAHNVESLDGEGDRLARERTALIDSISTMKGELFSLVAAQYSPIAVNGRSFTPKEAAQFVASLNDTEFIPDALPLDAELPLTTEQVQMLYSTNCTISPEEEALLLSGAPDSAQLIQPSRMRQICAVLGSEGSSASSDLWQSGTERSVETLGSLREQLILQAKRVEAAEPWMLKLAQAGVADENGKLYSTIGEMIESIKAVAAEMKLEIIDRKPYIPDEIVSDKSGKLFAELREKLKDSENGIKGVFGKLSFALASLGSETKHLLEGCSVGGSKLDTYDEMELICRYHDLLLERKSLVRRWESAVVSLGGPALDSEEPEQQASMVWETVKGWRSWYGDVWQPIKNTLCSMGFRYDDYIERQPVPVRMAGEMSSAMAALQGDLALIVDAEYCRGDKSECEDMLKRASHELLPFAAQFAPAAALRDAIEQCDPAAYADAFDSYDVICIKREQCDERQRLIKLLAEVCPLWSSQIKAREGVNGGNVIPDDLSSHWTRALLRGELERRSAVSVTALQDEIEKQTAQLSALTRDLIAARAWAAQLRTMRDQSKKRSLAEWVELVKRVGKGTGKRAEQLRSSGELRRAMKNCRRAVPVWIMPLSAVAEYFEPSDEKFDVLIVDEASQADITSLIALYLARKVVVVGDDRQVSPTPIGLDIETSAKLRQEFLSSIPAASMYDEMVSLYDIAKANYEPITLREHFRCADDIINYSNYYTYNGIICPLRDSRSIKLHPSTVAYHVEGGTTGGKKTNRKEALMVAALIAACTEQKEYDGSTFGVITMTGDEQTLIIDRLLREKLSENVYQSRKILCGNPSYFQGDERDVIFISLVDSGKEDGGMLAARREGYNEVYAKRYNVAASRARDQMWVVHSLDPDKDLKSDDIRLGLIRHAADPAATAAALEKTQAAVLTRMEEAVCKALTEAGYSVTPRQKVGTYTVGLVCDGEGGRVAIECDGDSIADGETISAEINKQSVLERLGWRFLRLRATDFYSDSEGFAAGLPAQLEAMGLAPAEIQQETQESSLLSRVIARAEELAAEWTAPKGAAEQPAEAAPVEEAAPAVDETAKSAEAAEAEETAAEENLTSQSLEAPAADSDE